MKVLNLYSGIGGNRKLWENVEVTAVEIEPEIAKIYSEFFPNDKMVVGDAHKYLLEHYDEFDFIWSSPPCPTHSRIRNIAGIGRGQNKPVYPDMCLYQEIIFLKRVRDSSGNSFKGSWVVENVESYYEPLIKPYNVSRHYFWSNFFINRKTFKGRVHNDIIGSSELFGFNLNGFDFKDKRLLLRNLVEPELGLHVFECACKGKQTSLFGGS